MPIHPDFKRMFAAHDAADFAQEFLRRNPDYRQQYKKLGRLRPDATVEPETRELLQTWGLEFRHEPCRCRL